MEIPTLETLCAGCQHSLAVHYQTFGGQDSGCSLGHKPIDGEPRWEVCRCRGFTIAYTPAITNLPPGDVSL